MKKFNIVGFILSLFILLIMQSLSSQTNYDDIIDKKVKAIEQKVINWRHDFHQNPELGNREFRTADMDALPVTEKNDLSYKSIVISTYNGKETSSLKTGFLFFCNLVFDYSKLYKK